MAGRQVAQQSGQSWRYLYERLGEKPFQQMCNALLAHLFPEVTCFPVGHADGGRDSVLRDGKSSIVFQVKWSSKAIQDPATWLNNALDGEAESIRRLVGEGAEAYYLMTSVAGTATPDKGSMDRLERALDGWSDEFGIPVRCWWRADIDARLDLAPDTLKWSYSAMLAGDELVRSMIHFRDADADTEKLRAYLLKVLAYQWLEDSKVKFKQVELDSHDLADLFVDVESTLVSFPRTTVGLSPDRTEGRPLGGAAEYLSLTAQPFTLVRGEPGQGKSTLGQFLCQRHRAPFLRRADTSGGQATTSRHRFPLRVDLSDYAMWLIGGDPFSEEVGDQRIKVRLRRLGPLEEFLKDLLYARSGKLPMTIEDVHEMLHRLPTIIVLDGLDEVARRDIRVRVVKEINEFCARLSTSAAPPQVVVTTRPNASELPEPSPDIFETIALSRLSPALRIIYLRKWATVRSVPGRERRALERAFQQRSAEPHIDQLADNPMQLTILLYLLQKRANSVPTNRTSLYTSYMETFLDREAAKTRAVEEHREDLEEVTSYLGWHLQARAEVNGSSGSLPTKDLKRAILLYLHQVNKEITLVEDLFTAVTDRVWALTSKVQHTFEFDVQPVREYFAARYLSAFAGADQTAFDSGVVFRGLVQRSYWLNTCRFYAGFAKPNELSGMVEGLEEEWEATVHPRQVRLASWTLLADGVFSGRIKAQRRAADLFLEDLSVRLVVHALRGGDELPSLSPDRGGRYLVERLLASVAESVDADINEDRLSLVNLLIDDLEDFDAWWRPRMRSAVRTAGQLPWLRIGSMLHAGSRLDADLVEELTLDSVQEATAAYAAGIAPRPDSEQEHRILQAALSGNCSEFGSPKPSFVGDLLRVLAPHHLIRKASQHERTYRLSTGHREVGVSDTQRQSALQRLKLRDQRFASIQKAMRFSRGQAGTTSPWGNTARAVSGLYGACWLAAEIAIIGAASPNDTFRTGGDLTRDSAPLGDSPDYGRLLRDVRGNRANAAWWIAQFNAHQDSLSRRTWVLALLACAGQGVVAENLLRVDEVVSRLKDSEQQTLCMSSSRLGASGIGRRLQPAILRAEAPLSALTYLLLAHHAVALDEADSLPALDESALTQSARFGTAAWPALRALTARMVAEPSDSVLQGLKAHGSSSPAELNAVLADQSSYATRILADSAGYPLDWVLAAERSVSESSSAPSLPEVAEAGAWFSS